AENLGSAVHFISISNAKRQIAFIKCLHFNFFFFNSSSSECCPEPFFIMKNAGRAFSRYSNGQNTEHRMFLPSWSHIVMTNSHLRPLPPLKTKDMLMTIHNSNSS
ncbi:unnamed protein product, partial [Staurois parvus]